MGQVRRRTQTPAVLPAGRAGRKLAGIVPRVDRHAIDASDLSSANRTVPSMLPVLARAT
jgi:hypothetical protein